MLQFTIDGKNHWPQVVVISDAFTYGIGDLFDRWVIVISCQYFEGKKEVAIG